MKVGDITEVTQTSRGYQIFKLEVRTDAALVPLEDIRTDISRRVADSKRQTEMVKYLEKLRGQAKISWKHDELHKAYDRAVMQRLERAGLSKPAPKG
jgi:parvulin-like peptidyl-prolyl isomerase